MPCTGPTSTRIHAAVAANTVSTLTPAAQAAPAFA